MNKQDLTPLVLDYLTETAAVFLSADLCLFVEKQKNRFFIKSAFGSSLSLKGLEITKENWLYAEFRKKILQPLWYDGPFELSFIKEKIPSVYKTGILSAYKTKKTLSGFLCFFYKKRISPNGRISNQVDRLFNCLLAESDLIEEINRLTISESTYRSLFDSVLEAIYIQDENGVFLDVNAGAERMYGYPREYFIGKTPAFISAPGKNDLRAVAEAVQKAFQGQPQQFEYWGRRKDGEIFPKNVRLYPGKFFGKNVVIALAEDITKLKQTETILRQNEERYRLLFESASDAILLMDGDRFVECNPQALRLFGCTREQILNQPPYRFSPEYQPDGRLSREKALEKIHTALQGQSLIFEWTHCRYDNTLFEAEVSLNRIQIENRWMLQAIVRDVTERKRAEEIRRENDIRLRHLSDNLPNGFVYQMDTGINLEISHLTYISAGVEKISGLTPEIVMNKPELLHRIVVDSDRERVAKQEMEAIRQRQPFHSEFRVQLNSGEIRWWYLSSAPYIQSNGHVVWDGIVLDITELKKAEQSIRDSEERFRKLFESSPIPIILAHQGIVLFANAAFKRSLGLSPEETIIGRNILEFIHPDDRERIAGYIRNRALGYEAPEYYVCRGMQKDGSVAVFEVNIAEVVLSDGKASMAFFRDITRREQMQKEIFQKDALLEALAFAAEEFLVSKDWEQHMHIILERLGKAAQVSRVYIFQVHNGGEKPFLVSQRFEWCHPSVIPQINNPDLQNLDLVKTGFQQLIESLTANQIFSGHVREMPENVNRFLSAQDIKSIVIIPIFVEQQCWGFIGFDQCDQERIWSSIELDLIKAAAKLFAKAIETKQAEQRLRQSEERYKTLIETSQDGISLLTLDGMIVFCNERKAKMLGFNCPYELTGQWAFQYLTEKSRQSILSQLPEMIQAGHVSNLEAEISRRDGSVFPAEFSGSVLYDTAGKPEYIMYTMRDITRRKEAEEQLLASKRELQRHLVFTETLLNAIPTPVFFKDKEGRYIGCNKAFTDLTGLTSESISGKTVFDLWEPEKAAIYFQMDQELMRHPVFQVYEFKIKDKTGEERDVIYAKDVFRDEKGEIAGIVGAFMDISDRKKTEAALRDSEDKYRQLIEHSNDAIYFVFNRRFEIVNRKFLEIFDITLEDVQKPDFDLLQLVAPKSRSMIEERQNLIQSGVLPKSHFSFTGLSRSGREIELEASVSYIPYHGGYAIQGILRDITERNRMEQQLRQAQKMEAVGQLAAGVAHDFNNILTIISGYSSLMLMDPLLPPTQAEKITEIKKAGERAQFLTNQLLAFSRKQVVNPEPIDINKLIHDSMKMITRLIGEDIQIKLNLSEPIPLIMADPIQIDQILINLLVNARDAIHERKDPQAKKIITIETREILIDPSLVMNPSPDDNLRRMQLTIGDTGVGMDEVTRQKIFEPFFTTKEIGRGTGLGLATVYGIIKQNNASIHVYSEPHIGTTFKILWPITTQKIADDSRSFSEKDLPHGDATLLLVEDNEAVREMTIRILNNLGYAVISAAHGEEALDKFREHQEKIQLLLTDLVMPGISGRELADAIHQIKPDLPVIYTSGYTDDQIIHRGVLKDRMIYLQKPFNIQVLAETLYKALHLQ